MLIILPLEVAVEAMVCEMLSFEGPLSFPTLFEEESLEVFDDGKEILSIYSRDLNESTILWWIKSRKTFFSTNK